MPFPLAHPAAVIPLKRLGSKWLSLTALVVGSISPDFGYCFGRLRVEEFSHHFLGTFVFCLPAGLVVVWGFYRTRAFLVRILPASYQAPFQQLCFSPSAAPLVIVASLLIGAWTHVLWDAFTHKQGWFVLHSPLLQTPVASLQGHKLCVFHLLSYLSTFVGTGWLFLVFDKWMRTTRSSQRAASAGVRLGRAALVSTLILLLAPLHHLPNNLLWLYCAGLVTVLIIVGLALVTGLARTLR
jgi:hypothetical protein